MAAVDLGTLAPAPRRVPSATAAASRGRCCCRARSTRPRLVATPALAAPVLRRRGHRRSRGAADRRAATGGSGSTAAAARRASTWRCAGSVGAAPPYEAALRAGGHGDQPRPLPARAAARAAAGAERGRLRRGARSRGRSRRPSRLRGRGDRCPSCSCSCPEYIVRASEPVKLSYADGPAGARAASAWPARAPTSSSSGAADLRRRGPLAVSRARPRRPARARRRHAAPARERATRAPARRRLGHARGAPGLGARSSCEGAGVRVRGFPHGLEGLQGRVRFTESAAELEAGERQLRGRPADDRGRGGVRRRRAQARTTSARSGAGWRCATRRARAA